MTNVVEQLREGQEVRSVDGQSMGKIKAIWYGSDQPGSLISTTDEKTCFEVQKGGLLSKETLYLPCEAVADISGNAVTLKADADTVKATPSWHHKPAWIGRE